MAMRCVASVAVRGLRRFSSKSSISSSTRASINQEPTSDLLVSGVVDRHRWDIWSYIPGANGKLHGYHRHQYTNWKLHAPLAAMRIGTIIHNIEINPGEGGKLVRSAGTFGKILKEPTSRRSVLVKLPSEETKLIDTRCRATIGQVSNPSHGGRQLRKAGQSRWLGRRPVVRGVAMNPVDHPHGGGEGKSKSSGSHGKGSRTPWGKPTKGGYKTGPLKRKK